MKVQNKPDYLIFASDAQTGELEPFPNIARGWGITIEQTESKPPMEWMNDAFNRVDKNTLYLLQQGVPEWDSAVVYPVDAIIKYQSELYIAITENNNSIPSSHLEKWEKVIPDIKEASTAQKGIVQLSSAIDSDSEITAVTSKAIKTVNDLLSPISNHVIVVDNESRIYSQDKRYCLFVRDDGVIGGYDTTKNKIPWAFNESGELCNGIVAASNISGLQPFIMSLFSQVTAINGYVKLPNGIVVQWGKAIYLGADGVNGTIQSFYTTFPNSCYVIISSDCDAGVNSTACSPISLSQFKCWGKAPYGNAQYSNTGMFYIAIGC
ncbi:phage tail protein [Orbus wheelerorum]|uniref:phage tail protein n=1 Tax=Orbus wheelerorum TaxID=3074111 RepID=UPI00370D7A1C